MKISFHTLGCKLNQAETDELKKDLVQRGFSVVGFGADEDVAVVRACGVTCGASQTTREMIRQAKRRGAYVVAVGCLENRDLPEIDFVAQSNDAVINHLKKFELKTKVSDIKEKERTRALVKIQTGCNFNCAYCAIPSFRGKTKSVAGDEVIKKIQEAEKIGYKEIVLTGVNICLYKDCHSRESGNLGYTDLAGLLEKILCETKIERIRLGSLDPRMISKNLIEIFSGKNKRLMSHWHLSLQSGANSVLKRMRRNYTAAKYFAIVKKLRRTNPLFSFTTDIIVGFPGETEKEFQQTCALVKKIGFAKVHIFPYSSRPGTAAAKMPDQVLDKIKKVRAATLKKICDQTAEEFAKKFLGKTRPVLFENKKSGWWPGYTPEFLRVEIKSAKNLWNKIVNVSQRAPQ